MSNDPFWHWTLQIQKRGRWETVRQFDGIHEDAMFVAGEEAAMHFATRSRVIQRNNPPPNRSKVPLFREP